MHFTALLAALLLPSSIVSLTTPTHHLHKPAPYDREGFIAETPRHITHHKRTEMGGVTVSDGANFTGDVWFGVLPFAECIALNSYAGDLGSFRPDEGMECYLYQGECNGDEDFADLYNGSPQCPELAEAYPWISQVESFMCFAALPLV